MKIIAFILSLSASCAFAGDLFDEILGLSTPVAPYSIQQLHPLLDDQKVSPPLQFSDTATVACNPVVIVYDGTYTVIESNSKPVIFQDRSDKWIILIQNP